jgi:hypothetical protein
MWQSLHPTQLNTLLTQLNVQTPGLAGWLKNQESIFIYIFQSRDGLVGIGQQPLIVRLPRTLYTEVQPIKIVIALARDPLGWRRT